MRMLSHKKIIWTILAMLCFLVFPMTVSASEQPQAEYMAVQVAVLDDVAYPASNVYTGQAIELKPVVSYKNTLLVEGVDYTLSYENNINAGTDAVVIVTGCGDYEGITIRKNFTIEPAPLGNLATLTKHNVAPKYGTGDWCDFVDGEIPYLDYTLTGPNGEELVEGKDYIYVTRPFEEGDTGFSYVFYGLGNYRSSISDSFGIEYPNIAEEGDFAPPLPVVHHSLRFYHNGRDQLFLKEGQTVDGTVQFIDDDCISVVYQLYWVNLDTVDDGANMEKKLVYTERCNPDTCAGNSFTYTFNTSGAYVLTYEWKEYEKKYNTEGGYYYDPVKTGVEGFGAYGFYVEEEETADGQGGGVVNHARYAWMESVEPGEIVMQDSTEGFLRLKTTPERNIKADSYTTSNKKIVNVYSDGIIHLIGPGTATITAKVGAEEVKWTITVTEDDISDAVIDRYNPADKYNTVKVINNKRVLMFNDHYKPTITEHPEIPGVSIISVKGFNFYTGTATGLFYTDTWYPYICEHKYTSEYDATCEWCNHKRSVPCITHSGEWTTVNEATYLKAGEKERVCTVCGETETETIPKLPCPFTDVKEGAWYYNAVMYAYENGLLNGTGTNFSPNDPMTRGMLVTVFYRMEGRPEASADTIFPDVNSKKYYAKAISWAAEENIVSGYSNGNFGPEDSITREQIAKVLYRYAQYKGYDVTATQSLDGFEDASSVSSYARKYMQWATAEGLIKGSNGVLNPKGNATRAEISAILKRFIEKYE